MVSCLTNIVKNYEIFALRIEAFVEAFFKAKILSFKKSDCRKPGHFYIKNGNAQIILKPEP